MSRAVWFVEGNSGAFRRNSSSAFFRPARPVAADDAVAELGLRLAEPFSGVSGADQELARAVHFALEMELNGWEPAVLPGFA